MNDSATSINNLPNSSDKEEDIVNKILQELETDDDCEETVENTIHIAETPKPPKLPKPNQKIDKIFFQPPPQNSFMPLMPTEVASDEKNPIPFSESKQKSFFSAFLQNFNMSSLIEYAQLAIVSIIAFLIVIFFTPKCMHVVSKFPILVTGELSLSKLGICLQSFIHGCLFFLISLLFFNK
jgi:hypothetical protein